MAGTSPDIRCGSTHAILGLLGARQGGVGWVVRVGQERAASVAYYAGAGHFAKWITLSIESEGGLRSTVDLVSVYTPPGEAMGMSKDTIRAGIPGAMESVSGQCAVIMGDVNCDLREDADEAGARREHLTSSGFVAIATLQAWGQVATRVPRGNQAGIPRHIDLIAASGPTMAKFSPMVESIGTNTELDQRGGDT